MKRQPRLLAGKRAPSAQPLDHDAFLERCESEGVPARDCALLWELLGRWKWPVAGPTETLAELFADYAEWRQYLQSRENDPRAARAFERRWSVYARKALGWRLGGHDVDELTGAFFERVYRLIGNEFGWRTPFTVYLRTILVNLARSHVKRQPLQRSLNNRLPVSDNAFLPAPTKSVGVEYPGSTSPKSNPEANEKSFKASLS